MLFESHEGPLEIEKNGYVEDLSIDVKELFATKKDCQTEINPQIKGHTSLLTPQNLFDTGVRMLNEADMRAAEIPRKRVLSNIFLTAAVGLIAYGCPWATDNATILWAGLISGVIGTDMGRQIEIIQEVIKEKKDKAHHYLDEAGFARLDSFSEKPSPPSNT